MTERRVDWDDQQIQTLTTMWAAGDSCSRIARAIGSGATRCAVAGKARRLGLSDRISSAGREARKAVNWGVPRVPKAKPAAAQPVALPDPAVPLLIDGKLVTIETVSDRTCRWPIGHPGESEFHFCGQAPKGSAPYCEGHCRKAYVPVQPRSAANLAADRNRGPQRRANAPVYDW